jgi:hypothetical protein
MSVSEQRLGRRCDLCGDPVADDVVPGETIAGGVGLECMSCWMVQMEERETLHARRAS